MTKFCKTILMFLSAIAIVAGFLSTSPRSLVRSSMSMNMERSKAVPFLLKPALLDGSMAGDEGFDPLGLSTINDLGVDLYWMREAELKHCRIAMLAVVGALFQELGFVLPGQPYEKNQIDAFWQVFDRNPALIIASFLFIGIVEIFSGIAVTEGRKSGDRAPGEFGFNPLNFGKTPASAKDLALKEVRNGRLAMFAAAGILLQAATTGEGALQNLF